MKQNNLLKNLLISAAAALSLAAFARADVPLDEQPPEPTTAAGQGLLGQQYASLTYSHIDLDAPVNADNYSFGLNQPLNTGLDAVFGYDWTQAGLFAGDRLKQQSITAGLRAFSNAFAWGKPYVEAGGGYAWQRGYGTSDNSFVWGVGVGAEFQLAPAVTLTPFVKYADAPDLGSDGTFTYGVKANYWVESQWSIMGGISRDDDQNTSFTIGTNFRF